MKSLLVGSLWSNKSLTSMLISFQGESYAPTENRRCRPHLRWISSLVAPGRHGRPGTVVVHLFGHGLQQQWSKTPKLKVLELDHTFKPTRTTVNLLKNRQGHWCITPATIGWDPMPSIATRDPTNPNLVTAALANAMVHSCHKRLTQPSWMPWKRCNLNCWSPETNCSTARFKRLCLQHSLASLHTWLSASVASSRPEKGYTSKG